MGTVPGDLQDVVCRRQRDILYRVFSRQEESQVFLCGFERGSSDFDDTDFIGRFIILGSLRGVVRQTYHVNLFRTGPSFACTCPDHRRRHMSEGTLCKHISFIICKVAGITSPAIFDSKRLTTAQLNSLLERIEKRFEGLVNYAPTGTVETPGEMSFKGPGRPLCEDESCPICLSEMGFEEDLLACPMCHNNVHKGCMSAWLYRCKTCPFCRDKCWSLYRG